VGEHAVITGFISAGTVLTSGKINGTVKAAEKIEIFKQGMFIRDIRTPAIAIEDGAHFQGMCDRGAHKWVEEQSSFNKNVHNLTPHQGKIRPLGH
jgi:cytoskeletal protein CcmA (bactofilin family)